MGLCSEHHRLHTEFVTLASRKLDIMDNMLNMMEKYANNLEEIVGQRTAELTEEKKKTDRLLYSMLPRYFALPGVTL